MHKCVVPAQRRRSKLWILSPYCQVHCMLFTMRCVFIASAEHLSVSSIIFCASWLPDHPRKTVERWWSAIGRTSDFSIYRLLMLLAGLVVGYSRPSLICEYKLAWHKLTVTVLGLTRTLHSRRPGFGTRLPLLLPSQSTSMISSASPGFRSTAYLKELHTLRSYISGKVRESRIDPEATF